MSRNKRQIKEQAISTDKSLFYRFVFLSGKCSFENLKILDESIKRLKKELQNSCSFIILDSNESIAGKIIESRGDELTALSSPAICTIQKAFEKTSDSIANSKNNPCIWLNLNGLIRPINFNEFFRSAIPIPADNEYYRLNWQDEKSSEISGFIISQQTSDYLLSQTNYSKYPDICDFSWYLRQNHLNQKFHSVVHSFPYQAQNLFSKLNLNPVPVVMRFLDRNIISAFRGKQLSGVQEFSSNTGFSRLLFFIIALLSFVILPLISFNAGISGDEEKHYMQAEKVYNYFASDGKDTLALSDQKFKLNYYGQSFDLFTYVVIKKFHIEKVYEARHVMNGFIGAAAIVSAGLLARILIGDIAGIFTMLLLFFSPGYLGHAMNNPLDIPFAFGYIFTLLQLVRFLKRLPLINYWIALLISLGIAFTISIRIGGLVLIPYIFMFSGLYLLFTKMPWKNFSIPWIKLASKGMLVLSGISILAYFLSILTWPYALQNPLENPFKAMKMMENISVALRVMFDGKIIWSDNLPATYIPKAFCFPSLFWSLPDFLPPILFIRKNKNAFWMFLLLFVVIFPVVYIIYKESNVYGAWRHLLFIYPPMVVMAGMGMQSVLEISGNKFFQGGIILVFIASMINPAAHIIRNYPFQYIYFNEIAGGVKKAYKKFETDYYMVSLKPGTDWIKSNILKKGGADSSHPVRIISNAPSDIMNYYFREYKDIVKLPYTRYYDRGIYDWDYAIFFCNYIDPYQITHNIWPPKNTIHSISIDGVNICAIVKRENKDDFKGFELMNSAIRTRSRNELDESILLMENALKIDKYNEITYLNLGQAYILREEFDTARKKLNELLGFYPNYEKALNLIGYSYLNEGEIKSDEKKIERAISIFNDVIRINHKFAGAYHNLGLAFLIRGDEDTAFGYFQKSIDNNPNSKESYFMMANILDKRGDPEQARKVREYAKRL